jgi:hypothetical protein
MISFYNIINIVKDSNFISIIDLLNIFVNNTLNDQFKNITERLNFLKRIFQIKIKQGNWSPYCIFDETMKVEYSQSYWNNLFDFQLSPIQRSILIWYFIKKTRLCIKTYGSISKWFAIIYDNCDIRQLPTDGGYLMTNFNEYQISIEYSFGLTNNILKINYYNNNFEKINDFNNIIDFNMLQTILSKNYNLNNLDKVSNYLLGYY